MDFMWNQGGKEHKISVIVNYLFIKIWQYWLCLIQKGNTAFSPVEKGKEWMNARKATSPSQRWHLQSQEYSECKGAIKKLDGG